MYISKIYFRTSILSSVAISHTSVRHRKINQLHFRTPHRTSLDIVECDSPLAPHFSTGFISSIILLREANHSAGAPPRATVCRYTCNARRYSHKPLSQISESMSRVECSRMQMLPSALASAGVSSITISRFLCSVTVQVLGKHITKLGISLLVKVCAQLLSESYGTFENHPHTWIVMG